MDKNKHSIYGIQIQEWLAVKHGIKPLLRTAIQPENFKNVEMICKEKGLFSLMKSFNQLYGANLGSPINIIYISKSEEVLRKAYLSEKSMDRKLLGKLLGYPSCCVEFFSETLRNTKLYFPVKTYIKTGDKPSFLTNNIFKMESRLDSKKLEIFQSNPDFADRVSHLFLISHIPCSYNCKGSIKIGKKILRLLEREYPELAKEIVSILKKPLLFFNDFNWIVFDGKVDGTAVNYTSVLPPLSLMQESLVKKFSEGNKVEVGNEFIEIFKEDKMVHRIKKKHEYDGIVLDF